MEDGELSGNDGPRRRLHRRRHVGLSGPAVRTDRGGHRVDRVKVTAVLPDRPAGVCGRAGRACEIGGASEPRCVVGTWSPIRHLLSRASTAPQRRQSRRCFEWNEQLQPFCQPWFRHRPTAHKRGDGATNVGTTLNVDASQRSLSNRQRLRTLKATKRRKQRGRQQPMKIWKRLSEQRTTKRNHGGAKLHAAI